MNKKEIKKGFFATIEALWKHPKADVFYVQNYAWGYVETLLDKELKADRKKPKKIKDEVFYEDGHALAWVEFEEMGCPSNKKDTEKKHFLNKKEILRIANEIRKHE